MSAIAVVGNHDHCMENNSRVNTNHRVIYVLKIPTKLDFVFQTCCQDQNPDQDQDSTFKFDTKTVFYRSKISTKFYMSNDKTYIKIDRQTEIKK